MKKRIWFMAAILVLLILATVVVSIRHPASQDDMQNVLSRVENALGDEWKKQAVTEVYDFVYANDNGTTIIYYVCVTTYYEEDPNMQAGLSTDAITAVIGPFDAESGRECSISGLPGAIYEKNGHAFLCWTILPELTCVIEYDPTVVEEADIICMAESVPANY